jgi:hypothetical protein
MRRTLVAALTVMLAASVAHAEGINLSWNECGSSGTQNLTWTCDTNSGGTFSMYASFIPPTGVNEFLGVSSQVDIFTESGTLPDWWKHGGGQCRSTTGLAVSFDFTSGPFGCTDFYSGQAAGGFAYDVAFGSPNRARFRIQLAVPFENRAQISPAEEHYAYRVNMLRAKTTGTGSCAGCNVSACIVLNDIQLFQPPEQLFDPLIFNPAGRNFVTWQLPVGGPPGCPFATPTRQATWGQVKSLYR